MSKLFWLAPAAALGAASLAALADPLPPDTTYRPLPTLPFSAVKRADEAQKPSVMKRQAATLQERYDLADRPMDDVMMSGGRKPVQAGVRVKLPQGVTWESLAAMSAAEIKERGLLPDGFKPLPHVKQPTGGQVFPDRQIDEIENGLVTPVQMEGLRLLLTPFPQEEFNQTEDRKVAEPSLGVACLDCHSNFTTHAAFHLTPHVRPQAAVRSSPARESPERSSARRRNRSPPRWPPARSRGTS